MPALSPGASAILQARRNQTRPVVRAPDPGKTDDGRDPNAGGVHVGPPGDQPIGQIGDVPAVNDRAPLERLLRMQNWRQGFGVNQQPATWRNGGLGTTIPYDQSIFGSTYAGPTIGPNNQARLPWAGPGPDPRPASAQPPTAPAPAGISPGTLGPAGAGTPPPAALSGPNRSISTNKDGSDRHNFVNTGRPGESSMVAPADRNKSAANAIATVMRTTGRTKPVGAMLLPGRR